ncbi:Lymphoid-specific helicase [Holothuria leucospilota]|uniref:Proliferation-associated SNF2-like protein n=1 Tax=Holothuria leucospilota TaxID=206669 RepID=A0A9Q0YGJ9_HOLLE|nr:Lymphoid-specific helicase [Holothuria leucospilota]
MVWNNNADMGTPEKPSAEAGTPLENAHLQRQGEPDKSDVVSEKLAAQMETEDLLAKPVDSPNTPGSSGRTTPVLAGDVITETMLREEEELRQKGKLEEKKLEEESKESFEQELMEQRYKRLQHLLQKSSIYANFLLMKMEQQQKKEEKKQEKKSKATAKEEEKKATETAKTKSEEETAQSQESQDEVTSETSSSTSRRTRRGKASPKAAPKQAPKVTNTTKRKRPATETYSIEQYVDKEVLAAKKLKSDGPLVEVASTSTSEDIKPDVKDLNNNETTDSYSRIIDGQRVSDKQPMSFSGGVLRPYQLEGFEWLKVLYENGVNGILADEMGLGKTIQVIALFSHIIEMGVPGPFLVCAPLSTLPNWISEFARFSPEIPVILYHGSIDERKQLRLKIRKHLGKFKVQPVVVTSYEIVMRDRKNLDSYLWKYVVVDEGHRIKNLNCRLIQELKMYKTANRLLLTGTPLQNNLSELWSMLNFLLPEVFDDLKTFESWFDFTSLSKEGGDEEIIRKEREKNVLSMLHQILSPFLLRRLKTDVDLTIPKKKEILVHAPLSPMQEEFYRATVNKTILTKIKEEEEEPKEPLEYTASGRPKRSNRTKVDYAYMLREDDTETEEEVLKWAETFSQQELKSAGTSKKVENKKSETNIKLLNIVMQLRKCCNHPYLLSYPLDPVTQQYRIDEELITSSGKLMVLERLLPALKKNGHKVLVFSQMTSLLDILHDYCVYRNYNFCRLDGSMSFQERMEQMEKFRIDPDSFLFLLSTRAGGLGINLTTADTVIIYDSDWNPQSDLQAMDRCHRIGQEKPVVVYRLVTAGTVDQKIVERAAAKRKLEKMVIHQGKFKGGAKNLEKDFKSFMNPTDLLELLRSHDYSGVVNNCKGKVISDADLKMLLDRSDLLEENTGKKPVKKVKIKSKVFEIIDIDDGSKVLLS